VTVAIYDPKLHGTLQVGLSASYSDNLVDLTLFTKYSGKGTANETDTDDCKTIN
jgi:hypothetical protein